MIKDKCFTEEWLDQFKKEEDHRRIAKIILEKMIYVLHMVERLRWDIVKCCGSVMLGGDPFKFFE